MSLLDPVPLTPPARPASLRPFLEAPRDAAPARNTQGHPCWSCLGGRCDWVNFSLASTAIATLSVGLFLSCSHFKLGAALDSGKFHSYTCSCHPLLKTSQQSLAPLSSDQRSHQCKTQYLVLSLTSTALSSHSLPEDCNPLYETPAEPSFHLQTYLLFPPQCMDLPSKSNPQI